MKVYRHLPQAYCGECRWAMVRQHNFDDFENAVFWCVNSNCSNHGKKVRIPPEVVDAVPIEDKAGA